MRIAGALLLALVLAALVPGRPATGLAAPADAAVTLLDVFHTLDGRQVTVSGILRNSGAAPLRGLIIDVTGYGPGGELAASGTDGIPWEVRPGATERFSVSFPLGPQLVREYVVQVTLPRASGPLATARRTIHSELYRQHIRSLITLDSSTRSGFLIVRAATDGLPVSQVLVRASLWALDPLIEHFRLVTLDFDVPAGGSKAVFVSSTQAILVSLQIVDVRLRASWAD